jgi:glycosyltransferase involved in cell wall biosynthesis
MLDAGHRVDVVVGRGRSPDARARTLANPLLDSSDPRILALRAELDAGRIPPGLAAVTGELIAWLRGSLAAADVVIAHNVASLHFNLPLTVALHDLAAAGDLRRLVRWHHDLAWLRDDHRSALHEGEPWDLLRRHWPGVGDATISATRRAEIAHLFAIDPDSIAVVPHGVDLDADLDLATESVRRLSERSLLDLDPLLLTPVRLTRRKNVELGLHVIAHLRAAGRPAGLIVTGPVDPHDPTQASYRDALVALRRDLGLERVAWLVAVDEGTAPSDGFVRDLYRVADALFLPSREEGFGLPVLEAAAHRLPVACAALPVLRELAGDDALLFEPGADPRGLAADLSAWLAWQPSSRLGGRVRREMTWPRIYAERLEPWLAIWSA